LTAPADFNLLTEPWIPATRRDGSQEELSILELLSRATEFVSIGGELPTQQFAITRLLLAFLHRALDGPATAEEWADLWEAAEFPDAAIGDYARTVHHRFNLFDPGVPFMQVAGLRSSKDTEFGLERIVAEFPSNKRLFTARSERNLQQRVQIVGDLGDRLGVLRTEVDLERLDRDLGLVDVLGVVDVLDRRQRR